MNQLVIYVIITNCLITFLNLYGVYRLIIWRNQLIKFRENLTRIESSFKLFFASAPQVIARGKTESYYLTKNYQLLKYKQRKIKQILALTISLCRLYRKKRF